jgi:hypothetical protein
MTSLDAFADAVHDLLHARAQSIGAIDVAVEVNDPHLDGEVLFGDGGPDMGFAFDSGAGSCSFCELVPPDSERWLEDHAIDLTTPVDDEARAEAALALLRGLLDARRPLLSGASQ